MRKLFLLVLLCLLFRNSYADSTYVAPSFYYTHGAYNNTDYSNSLAFYNTTNITQGFYLINHYEHLTIHDPSWNYLQQAFLAGAMQAWRAQLVHNHVCPNERSHRSEDQSRGAARRNGYRWRVRLGPHPSSSS